MHPVYIYIYIAANTIRHSPRPMCGVCRSTAQCTPTRFFEFEIHHLSTITSPSLVRPRCGARVCRGWIDTLQPCVSWSSKPVAASTKRRMTRRKCFVECRFNPFRVLQLASGGNRKPLRDSQHKQTPNNNTDMQDSAMASE